MAATITMTSCVPRSGYEETGVTIAWTYTGSPGTLHFWMSTDGTSYTDVGSSPASSSPKNVTAQSPGVFYYWRISDYADAIRSNVMTERQWKIGELQGKLGDSWRVINQVSARVSGTWTAVRVVWAKNSGVWKVIWSK